MEAEKVIYTRSPLQSDSLRVPFRGLIPFEIQADTVNSNLVWRYRVLHKTSHQNKITRKGNAE